MQPIPRETILQFFDLEKIPKNERKGQDAYRLTLAGNYLGVDAIIKKRNQFTLIELGFGFEYHGGSWVIEKPFAVWSGSTYQEPYETELGFSRAGQKVLHMGAGSRSVADAKKTIRDWVLDSRYNTVMWKAMQDRLAMYVQKAQHMSILINTLSGIFGVEA